MRIPGDFNARRAKSNGPFWRVHFFESLRFRLRGKSEMQNRVITLCVALILRIVRGCWKRPRGCSFFGARTRADAARAHSGRASISIPHGWMPSHGRCGGVPGFRFRIRRRLPALLQMPQGARCAGTAAGPRHFTATHEPVRDFSIPPSGAAFGLDGDRDRPAVCCPVSRFFSSVFGEG